MTTIRSSNTPFGAGCNHMGGYPRVLLTRETTGDWLSGIRVPDETESRPIAVMAERAGGANPQPTPFSLAGSVHRAAGPEPIPLRLDTGTHAAALTNHPRALQCEATSGVGREVRQDTFTTGDLKEGGVADKVRLRGANAGDAV